jgi:cytochrome c biogenesis protein CcdA
MKALIDIGYMIMGVFIMLGMVGMGVIGVVRIIRDTNKIKDTKE